MSIVGRASYQRYPLPCFFPSFLALLVGGSTIIPVLAQRLAASIATRFRLRRDVITSSAFVRLTRFISALLSAWFCFRILNRRHDRLQRHYGGQIEDASEKQSASDPTDSIEQRQRRSPEFAGSTLDLTVLVATRAADAVACIGWARWRAWRMTRNRWTLAESVAPKVADAGIFVLSSAVIMWAWFYLPERLPRSYGRWIDEAAQVDARLIEVLRRARRGEFVYGKDTGQAPFLQTMCKDYGWPMVWGDPAKTIPLPCEVVHMGYGPNCEIYAARRFLKTFKFGFWTYFPLQAALRARGLRSMRTLVRIAFDASRSSAFLALFVTLFYYSVCLARTRLGPKVFDKNKVTPMMWDSGLCVGAGCLMCGWSVLVEKASRRRELSLFVAPRAAATLLPRVYDKQVRLMPGTLARILSSSYTFSPLSNPSSFFQIVQLLTSMSCSTNTGSVLPSPSVQLSFQLASKKDRRWSGVSLERLERDSLHEPAGISNAFAAILIWILFSFTTVYIYSSFMFV